MRGCFDISLLPTSTFVLSKLQEFDQSPMPLIKYIKNDDGWPLVAPPPPKRVSPIGAKSVQTHAISYTTLDVRTALNGAPQTTNKPMKTMLIITHVRVSLRIWIAVWILLNAMAYFTFAFQFNVVATWLTIHKSRYWTIIVNIKCSRDFEVSIKCSRDSHFKYDLRRGQRVQMASLLTMDSWQ